MNKYKTASKSLLVCCITVVALLAGYYTSDGGHHVRLAKLASAGTSTSVNNSYEQSCETTDINKINRYITRASQSGMPEDAAIDEITHRWCHLTRISSQPTQFILASQSDVKWYNMSILWDNQMKVYVATASWKWTRQGYIHSDIVICANNEIGSDGISIRFSGEVNILGKSASAWGNPDKKKYKRHFEIMEVPVSTVSEYGVGFVATGIATKLQDSTGTCIDGQYDYNMWGGSATVTFKTLNDCKNVQMYPGYVHTWSDTRINSIGVDKTGLSVGWSDAGASWTKEENGPTANICM